MKEPHMLEFSDWELVEGHSGVWHKDAFLDGLIAGLANAETENRYAADRDAGLWFEDGAGLGSALRSLARSHWREHEDS